MTATEAFDPHEFLDRLRRDDVRPPITLHGMVKAVEGDDDSLSFAHGHTCADWIRIPLSSIEDVRVVRLVPCDGHRHPFVDLVLKPPATDEGVLFASLAQASHGRARRAGSTRTFGRYSPAISTPPERSSVSEARAIPHGPDAGDLLPSCSGCPAWVDDHGWFGILVGCSDTTCDYAEY